MTDTGKKKIEMSPRHGTCEMCGGRDRPLWMLYLGDFVGYACGECVQQLHDSMARRFTGTSETTEPAE